MERMSTAIDEASDNRKKSQIQSGRHPFNRTGMATGELVGGNLALLATWWEQF
jgi:muramoyltetrapeptide carboxypeptidase LdcA involved in peptidoglycan recycling